jgi:hypothetical protein
MNLKQGMRVWTRFILFRIREAGYSEHSNETSGFIKCQGIS